MFVLTYNDLAAVKSFRAKSVAVVALTFVTV
jgi:hypothetical protein